jgi:hypothetical protein
MISLLGKPFHVDSFDFADNSYFEQIFQLGDRISNDKMFRNPGRLEVHDMDCISTGLTLGFITFLNQA